MIDPLVFLLSIDIAFGAGLIAAWLILRNLGT